MPPIVALALFAMMSVGVYSSTAGQGIVARLRVATASALHKENQMRSQFRYPIEIEGRVGYIDRAGALVIPPRQGRAYARYTSQALELIAYTDDATGLVGLVDSFGEIVIEAKYRNLRLAGEYLWFSPDDGGPVRWGIMDRQEQVLLTPGEYQFVGEPSEGLWPVRMAGEETWKYINLDGRVMIDLPIETPADFVNGQAMVRLRGEIGSVLIDRNGTMIAAFPYSQVSRFSEGLAEAQQGWGEETRMSFINEQWEVVIPGPFELSYPFANGVAPVMLGEKWGVIDQKGDWVIQPQYWDIETGDEGVLAVGMQYETHDDPDDFEVRWKVIDAFGNELLPALYDLVLGFRGGLAYAKTSEGNECIEGYIDITGKWVFQQRRPKPCR